jgi:6,7-dimethyl-8-ribityllumazine synthase
MANLVNYLAPEYEVGDDDDFDDDLFDEDDIDEDDDK